MQVLGSTALLLLCAQSALQDTAGPRPTPVAALPKPEETKVIGGVTTPVEEFRFMMQLYTLSGRTASCTGSLIGPTHVLTAGHCARGLKEPSHLLIVFNEDKRTAHSPNSRRAKLIHPHRQYVSKEEQSSRSGLSDYDVAVILLDAAIHLTQYMKIAPQNSLGTGLTPGMILRVAGWGRVERGEPNIDSPLQSSLFTVLDRTVCRAAVRYPVSNYEFCIGVTKTHTICAGDSGSPAFVTESSLQFGVHNYGSCGRGKRSFFVDLTHPDVHAFVAQFAGK